MTNILSKGSLGLEVEKKTRQMLLILSKDSSPGSWQRRPGCTCPHRDLILQNWLVLDLKETRPVSLVTCSSSQHLSPCLNSKLSSPETGLLFLSSDPYDLSHFGYQFFGLLVSWLAPGLLLAPASFLPLLPSHLNASSYSLLHIPQ